MTAMELGCGLKRATSEQIWERKDGRTGIVPGNGATTFAFRLWEAIHVDAFLICG